MALHKKKAFADLCGMKSGNISNMVTRGHVVYSGDYIDDEIEPNKSFLKKRREILEKEGKTIPEPLTTNPDDTPNVQKPTTKKPKAPKTKKIENQTELYELNADKIKTSTLKMQLEMEKLRFQNAKFMGDIIPTGLIKPVILQHNQSIITASKNTLDSIIRILAKKMNLSPETVAEIKSEFTVELNAMIKKASVLTGKSVTNIIDDFAAKKGIGERT